MQNISLQSSHMCRKQNFKVVFGFKSGKTVLTFPFCFLLLSSFSGHLVCFISEDKIVYCDTSNEIPSEGCAFILWTVFLQVYSSVTTVWTRFFQIALTWLPNNILRVLLSLNLQNISLSSFFQQWKGPLEVLMPKETVQQGHMNILLQPMPLLKIM